MVLCCAVRAKLYTHTHTHKYVFFLALLAALSEITEGMFTTETLNRKSRKKRTKITPLETNFGIIH